MAVIASLGEYHVNDFVFEDSLTGMATVFACSGSIIKVLRVNLSI